MNLYLLSQTINKGHDTFDSCIVCAETEQEAKTFHPDTNCTYSPIDGKFPGEIKYSTWVIDTNDIQIQKIGAAIEGRKKGIVLASFKSG